MIISVRKMLRLVRFLIVFAALVYMFYNVFNLFSTWITPVDHYKIPEGNALKVFHPEQGTGLELKKTNIIERLRFYYWYGE
ncbi:YqzK family protein [Neobacillus mesonae]|nr:YqzK family protein [Neobacillus mesonae]